MVETPYKLNALRTSNKLHASEAREPHQRRPRGQNPKGWARLNLQALRYQPRARGEARVCHVTDGSSVGGRAGHCLAFSISTTIYSFRQHIGGYAVIVVMQRVMQCIRSMIDGLLQLGADSVHFDFVS